MSATGARGKARAKGDDMTITLVALCLILVTASDTAIGRMLHRALVAAPLDCLARIERRTMLVLGLLALIGLSAVWLLGHEGLGLYGMATPDLAALLTSFEVSSFLDAAVVAVVAASSVRWSAVRAAVARRLGRPRAVRHHRVRRAERPSANDDEDGPVELAA